MRASDPSPSTSWACIIATWAREASASRIRLHHACALAHADRAPRSHRPANASQHPATSTTRAPCRGRACPCRRPGPPRGSRTGGRCRERPDRSRTAARPCPESRASRAAASPAGVITPRSSATRATDPSSATTASNTARPGPRCQRPDAAVRAPAGTAQYETNPRKWSIRARSNSDIVRRSRSTHQRYRRRRSAGQSYSGFPHSCPDAEYASGGAPATNPRPKQRRMRAMIRAPRRHVDRHVAEQPHPGRQRRTTAAHPTRARTAPGRPRPRDRRTAPSRPPRTPRAHETRKPRAADTGARGSASSPGHAANAERALYGEPYRSGGPSGSTCHHVCPAAASQSTNRYASGPSRPPGKRRRCAAERRSTAEGRSRRNHAKGFTHREEGYFSRREDPVHRRSAASLASTRVSTQVEPTPAKPTPRRRTTKPPPERIVIQYPTPAVDDGRYPAKRVRRRHGRRRGRHLPRRPRHPARGRPLQAAAGAATGARPRWCADRRPPRRRALGGQLRGRPQGQLGVHDRGLDRRVRHLARRARAQGRRAAARPGRRALRGRPTPHRRGRRSQGQVGQGADRARDRHAVRRGRARDGQARRRARPRAVRDPRADPAPARRGQLDPPLTIEVDRAPGQVRRLVRAVPAILGRPERRRDPAPEAGRARLRHPLPPADPPDRPHQPQGPQQLADRRHRPIPARPGRSATRPAATTRSTRPRDDRGPQTTHERRQASTTSRSRSTSRSSARPTTRGCTSTPSGSTAAPTAPSSTPRTRPSATRTSTTSTGSRRTGRACGTRS